MGGNFKIIYCLAILLQALSCNPNKKDILIGSEIINQNFNIFFTDLPIFPSIENTDGIIPVVINDSITKNDFIINYCQDECFDKINKEGFNVSKKTKYIEFLIKKLPEPTNYPKIFLVNSYDKLEIKEYIGLNFYNFYINKEYTKAFIIVEKIQVAGKGGKTEVYFFEKQVDTWKFCKKELLLIG